MTQPLIDADTATRTAQAPRFVSAVALADATARALLLIGALGWLLGVAALVAGDQYEQATVPLVVAIQALIGASLAVFATQMARRGAAVPAQPLPAGVVLVAPAETHRAMQRAWAGGMLIAIVLLAVMTAGNNQSLLGGWSAAMIALGVGQRARARAFAARELQLNRSLWVPERRTGELPRLATGAPRAIHDLDQ